MKAHEGVIEVLKEILTAELLAINQAFVQAKLCEHWGYERLSYKLRGRSLAVMRDADRLIGHILYLDGRPRVHRLAGVPLGETVPEQLRLDRETEQNLLRRLSDGVRHCAMVRDFTTRHLLEDMVRDVDAHLDWLDRQMATIDQVGLEHYLAEQIRHDGS